MQFFSPEEDYEHNFMVRKSQGSGKKGYLRGPYVKYTK